MRPLSTTNVAESSVRKRSIKESNARCSIRLCSSRRFRRSAAESGILSKCSVHRVGVDATHLSTLSFQVLREIAAMRLLPTPPLPCRVR